MTTSEPSPPETVELLPCPFCGETVREVPNFGFPYIECIPCELQFDAGIDEALRSGDFQPARDRWNTRTTAESASREVSEEDVERVAKAMWDASPYSDGSAWDHVSMRRYGGTSDTRELYLMLARAAIAAVSGGVV